MTARFYGDLVMEEVLDPKGIPLTNRGGRQLYRVTKPLGYWSDVAKTFISVPKGFITDLASVPKLPFVYLLLNGVGDMPGVVHDYLYSTGQLPRQVCDEVLKEACMVTGVAGWKVALIYAGVRVGGSSHFGPAAS